MAFKERFKDKTTVVGKQGEGAMLIDNAGGAPKPAAKKAPGPMPEPGPGKSLTPPPAMAPPAKEQAGKGAAPSPSKGKAMPPPSGSPPPGLPPPMLAQPPQQPGGKKSVPMPMPLPPPGNQKTLAPAPMTGPPPLPGKQPPGKAVGPSPPPAPGGKAPAPLSAKGAAAPPPKGSATPVATSPTKQVQFAEADPVERYDYGKHSQPPEETSAEKEARMRAFGQALPPKHNPLVARRAASNPGRPGTEPQDPPKYKVKTLEEWRSVKSQPEVHRGGLGPSDTDEQRFYRLMRKRAAEYANESNRINMALLTVEPKNPLPEEKPLTKEQIELNERRKRALEFARQVPKPKVRTDMESNNNTHNVVDSSGLGSLPPRRSGAGQENDIDDNQSVPPDPSPEMLAELEAKHHRDQEMIDMLKKQLKL
jgi:hypothetical protein